MVFIVGLTGGIGSGKTSVAKLFATWGATVVDADQIAHNLLAPGSKALTQVAKRFGANIIDDSGQLNRGALAKIVFTNPTARTDLENITHPLIAAQAPHHWIITNNTTPAELQTQTKKVWQAINALTQTTTTPNPKPSHRAARPE